MLIVTSISLLLSACNQSGEGNNFESSSPKTNEPTSSVFRNFVELGFISGGNVVISSLDGQYNLYSTTTDTQGSYTINTEELSKNIDNYFVERPDYLLVSATGGYDINPQDTEVNETGEVIPLLGTVKGIISTKTLLNEDHLSINLLSTAVAELLKSDSVINEDKLAYMASRIGISDVNNDKKIDNIDIVKYSMVHNSSDAESILRPAFLPAIHQNNTVKLIEITQDLVDKYGLIFMRYEVNGDTAYINLNPSNTSTHIYYGIDIKKGDLISDIYSESISINKNQYVIYQECNKSNQCSSLQVAAFDGKVVKPYYVRSSSFVYNNLDDMNVLRNNINKKSIELSELNAELASNNSKIG